jgi:hypothetical protein
MQAVRFHGKTDIRLEEIPIPVCNKRQVKLCFTLQDTWLQLLFLTL